MNKNPTIQDALARAHARVAERAELTVEDLVHQLEDAYSVALHCDPPQCSAAVAATLGIGKLLGLVIDRSQVAVPHKPALSSTQLELSEDEWKRQFAPNGSLQN